MGTKTKSEPAGQRILSIDALRGFDMLWIIGGSEVLITLARATGFEFLSNMPVHFDHSWGQFHFYDLIMPLFLFIVGVVMPVSFDKRLARGDTRKMLYTHIIKRVIILYVLGLIASGHIFTYDISKIHLWTDTLHAIAVYVATHLFDFSKIGNIFVGGLAKYLGQWSDFVEALAALTVVWLILYWMYRKKTFIKI